MPISVLGAYVFLLSFPIRVVEGGKLLDFSDLAADSVVMFQKKYDPWFAQFMCFVAPALIAKYGWGEQFWIGFWIAGALRYVAVLHFTWYVNHT